MNAYTIVYRRHEDAFSDPKRYLDVLAFDMPDALYQAELTSDHGKWTREGWMVHGVVRTNAPRMAA